jgi:hypothetical protein
MLTPAAIWNVLRNSLHFAFEIERVAQLHCAS